MKANEREIKGFEELLENCRLREEADEPLREHIRAAERRVYTGILKKTGRYGLFTGIGVWLYYLVKKAGLLILANKIMAVVLVISVAAGSVYLGSILTGKEKGKPAAGREQKSGVRTVTAPPVTGRERKKPPAVPVIQKGIIIKEITGSTLGEGRLDVLRAELTAAMGSVLGKRLVTGSGTGSTPRYLVFVRAEGSGGGYGLYVKVVDRESSEVILILTREVPGKEETGKALREIAREIWKKTE